MFELQVGLAVFPNIDCEIAAFALAIAHEDGFHIRWMAPKELTPHSVALVGFLKFSALLLRHLELPQHMNHGPLWVGSTHACRAQLKTSTAVDVGRSTTFL